jgi:HEAT repeat protein
MEENSLPPTTSPEAKRRRANLLLILVAAATVLVPFLFWQQTWFGKPLTDEQASEYLADREHPRRIQHALVQITERMERGDRTVERWYPQIAELKDSPVVELRVTLAWTLGGDTRSKLFHQTLLSLLSDPALLVRRNAALSLVRFGDASGKHEILSILQPLSIHAPVGGVVRYRAPEGTSVDVNAMIASVQPSTETPESTEVHAPLPGTVHRRSAEDGATVARDQQILVLAPAEDAVWEALRALYLIGAPEDLPIVEAFTSADYSDRIREQAALTAGQIRKRSTSASAQER